MPIAEISHPSFKRGASAPLFFTFNQKKFIMQPMKRNNSIINNKYAFDQRKCLKKLLFFPLITFLILFLFTSSNHCAASEIELIENSYGENKPMTPKILVAYATRAGSTAEVADAIGSGKNWPQAGSWWMLNL